MTGPKGEGDLSVTLIVPVLNDSEALGSLLERCDRLFSGLEVIVSDGGSDDDPAATCERYGARLVRGDPGRGGQMNRGAAAARGEILWFVHADALLHHRSLPAILETMKDENAAGGAFRFFLARAHWYKPLLDFSVNLRSRLFGRPYGDQALFVRRSVFDKMGGYPDVPLMEEVDFFRRMKRFGRAVLLSQTVGVSARRWESEGFFRTTFRNTFLLTANRLGVSADRLARWYGPVRSGAPGRTCGNCAGTERQSR